MSDPESKDPYIVALGDGGMGRRMVYRICWNWLYDQFDVHWLGRRGYWIHAARGNVRYFRTFSSRASAERALAKAVSDA